MSFTANRFDWRLPAATVAVWLSGWFEVALQESFHRRNAHLDSMVWLAMLPILVVGGWAWGRRYGRKQGDLANSWLHHFFIASALWVWVVIYGGAFGNKFKASIFFAASIYFVSWFLLRTFSRFLVSFEKSRLPIALAAGAWLFVASPPVIVVLWSEPVGWPNSGLPSTVSQANSHAAKAPTVIVLLFDELGFNSSDRIRQALVAQGLSVSSRSVEPTGDRTAQVISAMWLRHQFEEARVCSWSAICSGTQILDFSDVEVSWPDIDVVGFYFPYCAMNGLRFCRRESPSPSLDNKQRMSCAVRRRLGWEIPEDCVSNQHESWTALVNRVEQSYWEAPVWTAGGMLFAHLPIPHPPGSDAKATLVEHYETGVGQAVRLVTESAQTLKLANADPFYIVVVSDHPLRVDMWCSNGTYSKERCANAGVLRGETAVPLIVASSDRSQNLDRFARNDQLFDLITELRGAPIRRP